MCGYAERGDLFDSAGDFLLARPAWSLKLGAAASAWIKPSTHHSLLPPPSLELSSYASRQPVLPPLFPFLSAFPRHSLPVSFRPSPSLFLLAALERPWLVLFTLLASTSTPPPDPTASTTETTRSRSIQLFPACLPQSSRNSSVMPPPSGPVSCLLSLLSAPIPSLLTTTWLPPNRPGPKVHRPQHGCSHLHFCKRL